MISGLSYFAFSFFLNWDKRVYSKICYNTKGITSVAAKETDIKQLNKLKSDFFLFLRKNKKKGNNCGSELKGCQLPMGGKRNLIFLPHPLPQQIEFSLLPTFTKNTFSNLLEKDFLNCFSGFLSC